MQITLVDRWIEPALVIKANQEEAAKRETPKVFFYSLLFLTTGRYVIKAIIWADKRTDNLN